jgi:Ca-activated chloride channel family protein
VKNCIFHRDAGEFVRKRIITFALALALQGLVGGALSDEVGDETKTFAVQPGDALVINDDFGKIRIRPQEGANLDIKIQKTAPDQARKSFLRVESRRSGSTVFVNSFFSGASGEAIDFEIKAPKFMNVTISGANPEIDIAGVQGLARAQTVTGRITAENLTAAASLTTDSGDIIYRTNVQPQGDVRLESTSGNVYCELENGFSLRSWIRAGGNISWDMDPTLQATSLEKQLGTSGPLLYAGSLKGNVVVRLKPSVAVPATVALSQTTPTSGVAPKNPEPLPAVPKAAESRTTAPAPPAQDVQPVPSPATSKTSVPRTTAPAPASPAQEVKREPSVVEGQQPVVLPGTLKVDVDSVFLNVSVRDRSSNRSIGGLQKEDFRIYEDGVRQQVAQFLPSEAPFNLLLLLDVSGSTQSYLHLMKQASIDFTHQIKTNDRIAIATFSTNVQLVENFTNDRAVAERAINRIKSGGGTAFYDALMTCLNRYMRGVEGRSAIVVFTDGVDNQLEGRGGSRTTYDELYRRVQETDTVIYTIFLDTEGQASAITRGPTRRPGGIGGWPGGRRGGGFPGGYPFPLPQPSPSPNPRRQQNQRAIYEEARDQLLEIAEQTGGRMHSPHKIGELSGVYSEIADDLRIQYQLGYNSTNRARDGAWREIRVQVENRPEAVVRTRKGYYARKDGA